MDNIGLDRHNIMDLLTFKGLQESLMNLVEEKKPDTEIKECDSYTDQQKKKKIGKRRDHRVR